MWNLVSVRLEIVLLSVQNRCTVCAKRTIGSEIILDTMMVLVETQVDACFGLFGDSARLTQDRCMVFAKCTIGSEIVLDAPDRTPR